MFFIRFIITAVLAFGTFTAANPIKRDTSADQIKNVLSDLKSKTHIVVPQIKQLANSGNVNATTVRPLIDQLTNALNIAASSLGTISSNGPTGRGADQEIVELMEGIISEILEGLQPILSELQINIQSFLRQLEDTLQRTLSNLEQQIRLLLVLTRDFLASVVRTL